LGSCQLLPLSTFPQAIAPAGLWEKKTTPIPKGVPKNFAAKIPMIEIFKGSIPVFDKHSHGREAEWNAPADDRGHPLTVLEKTAAM